MLTHFSGHTCSDSRESICGLHLDSSGPSHLDNVTFINVVSNEYRHAAAITFNDNYKYHHGASSSVRGLTFDPDEGTVRIFEQGLEDGRGDYSIGFRDIDGSLTGYDGALVAKVSSITSTSLFATHS